MGHALHPRHALVPFGRLRHALDAARHRMVHRGASRVFEGLSRAWNQFIGHDYPIDVPDGMWALMRERVEALVEQDLQNVEQGYYPSALLTSFRSADVLRVLPLALELPRIFLRKSRGEFRDLPSGEDLTRYPDYYQRNFHWQTDGWLSSRSARMYRLQVEFLFLGCADVMRRQAIPPLVDALHLTPRPRVVDLACGNGDFLWQLRQALPTAQLYGVDLSPHYLELAGRRLAGSLDVTLMAENAEALPLAEGSFDAAVSIFLFHELPPAARRNVLTEALRILKPGGRLVLCDSLQYCDEAGREISYYLEWFPANYHEPFYPHYVRDPLEEALQAAGFEVLRTQPNFTSKVVVARKPAGRC